MGRQSFLKVQEEKLHYPKYPNVLDWNMYSFVELSAYLIENGNDSSVAIDTNPGMTLLHMLAMNPNPPVNSTRSLFNFYMEATFVWILKTDESARKKWVAKVVDRLG